MLAQHPHPKVARQEIFVAFGGNTTYAGSTPRDTILNSINELERYGFILTDKSSLYKTPCFPPGAGPDYVNAVAVYVTSEPPETCLKVLSGVENLHGRARNLRWGARTLDLDLLSHGDAVRPNSAAFRRWRDLPPDRQKVEAPDELILPHPRIQDRAFVLVPLVEVRPDWCHPVSGERACDMLARLGPEELDEIVPLPTG